MLGMLIHVKCPNLKCGRTLAVKGELAGTRGKCPACGTVVEIPIPDPTKSDDRLDVVRCPNSTCASQMRVPIGRGKLTVTCPKCKSPFSYDPQQRRLELIKGLESLDPKVRFEAVTALGSIGDEEAAHALLNVYFGDWTPGPDGSPYIRDEALKSLKKISLWTLAALIKTLQEHQAKKADEELAGRAAEAAQVLGYIADPRATDPLIAALKDENVSVARAASVALGRIGDEKAVFALDEALNDPRIRMAAADALRQIGGARAAKALRKIEKTLGATRRPTPAPTPAAKRTATPPPINKPSTPPGGTKPS